MEVGYLKQTSVWSEIFFSHSNSEFKCMDRRNLIPQFKHSVFIDLLSHKVYLYFPTI